ncbi:MAG: hypothetical protein NVS9B15_04640 [Acidobacteriaceae bacterium]
MLDAVDRTGFIPGRTLDRTAHDSPLCRQPDCLRALLRRIAETILKIGAHRQVGRGNYRGEMVKHSVARHLIVPPPYRERVSHAGRGQRFEAHMREYPSRPRVPGIGNEECARTLMQLPEHPAFVRLRHCHGTEILADANAGAPVSRACCSTMSIARRKRPPELHFHPEKYAK